MRAVEDYDRLGAEQFFSEHRFGPTTTYDLETNERLYPPKAILVVRLGFSWRLPGG
jgi:hypothetical protein